MPKVQNGFLPQAPFHIIQGIVEKTQWVVCALVQDTSSGDLLPAQAGEPKRHARRLFPGVSAVALLLLAACGHAPAPHPRVYHTPGAPKIGKPYQVNGKWYTPKAEPNYDEIGLASWYGPGFHGQYTASGEIYDQMGLTAAHKTLPLPTDVMVTNLENGRQLRLRVNDRGPFVDGRILDVTKRAAQLLEFRNMGLARVRVQILKDDGSPATRTPKDMPDMLYAQSEDAGNLPLKGESLPDLPKAALPQSQPQSRPPVPQSSRFAPRSSSPASASPPVTTAQAVPPTSAQAAAPTLVPASAPPAIGQTSTPVDAPYFIQIGSFGEEAKAQRFAAQIAALGNVTVTAIPVNGTVLWRVRLGPFTSRVAAEDILPDVTGQGFPDAMLVSGR